MKLGRRLCLVLLLLVVPKVRVRKVFTISNKVRRFRLKVLVRKFVLKVRVYLVRNW